MGEEHDETAPFQFFTDHIDPLIADATREGRKREFAAFTSFSGEEVPDPQALDDVRALAHHAAGTGSVLRRAARGCAASCRASSTCSTEGRVLTTAPRRRNARRRLRREDRGAAHDEPRGVAGRAVSARPGVGRRGHELLALLRERGARRALPLRRRRRGARSRCTSGPRSTGTAICPGVGPGSATATASTGPYDAGDRPALQRREAADRPVREGDRRRVSTGTRRTCCRTSRVPAATTPT